MSTKKNSSLDDFVGEIENIDHERKRLLEERNVWLKQAEAAGYPKAVVRKIVERRRKERDEVLAFDRQLREFELELGEDVV